MDLTKSDKKEIVSAIHDAEKRTSGEIRVHLKGWCGRDVLREAQKAFTRLKMHRTREQNGVLIFIVLKNREFAVVGDQGIHGRVGEAFWNTIRDKMAGYFSQGKLKEGILAGVEEAGRKLGEHFPRRAGDVNELPDGITED